MSPSAQLNFFPAAQADLHAALGMFRESGVKHQHFVQFVNSLVVTFRTGSAGATIVAGCPPGQTCDEMLAQFAAELQAFDERSQRQFPNFDPIKVRVPSSLSAAEMKSELFDRYRKALHAPRICHRTQPRYSFDVPLAPRSGTDAGRLVELMAYRQPSLVIVQDAQNFARSGASPTETRAIWRVAFDLAAQSGIPHLICGTPKAVLSVFGDAEAIANAELFVLRPYDSSYSCDDDSEGEKKGKPNKIYPQRIAFEGVLNDYDDVLPWRENAQLSGHFGFVDRHVAGDPDRVRCWITRALTRALAAGSHFLDWQHFIDSAPTSRQVELAHQEKKISRAFIPH